MADAKAPKRGASSRSSPLLPLDPSWPLGVRRQHAPEKVAKNSSWRYREAPPRLDLSDATFRSGVAPRHSPSSSSENNDPRSGSKRAGLSSRGQGRAGAHRQGRQSSADLFLKKRTPRTREAVRRIPQGSPNDDVSSEAFPTPTSDPIAAPPSACSEMLVKMDLRSARE